MTVRRTTSESDPSGYKEEMMVVHGGGVTTASLLPRKGCRNVGNGSFMAGKGGKRTLGHQGGPASISIVLRLGG